MKSYLFILLLVGFLYADDVYLKDGRIFQNVEILKTENMLVTLKSTVREFTCPVADIQRIEKKPFDPNTPSQTLSSGISHQSNNSQTNTGSKYVYPNVKLWPITVLAAAVAWDSFAESGKLQKQYDAFKEWGADDELLHNIESAKTRKMIVGGAAVFAGIVNTFFVFERVTITGDNGQIGLVVNF